MVRKFGQALAAAVIIVGVSSIANAGASNNGRGDQNVCGSSDVTQQTVSCLDKYEKDGIEVYCVTAHANGGRGIESGSGTALSCDWEHAKHPDNK
jgi:hypothetical protein